MMRRTLVAAVCVGLLVACGGSRPAAPAKSIKTFAASDAPITRDGVTADDGGWRIERTGPGSVALFEVKDPGVEMATLFYRAQLRGQDVKGHAFLEMWVRIPGRGEFFSRDLDQPLGGTQGWASYETPFFLNEPGLRPDLVKLNVAFDGAGGTVWVKDVELSQAPVG